MCQRVQCSKCGKPTWVGCGAHIEQVLGDVPEPDRCHCDDEDEVPYAQPAAPAASPRKSWLTRLLGG